MAGLHDGARCHHLLSLEAPRVLVPSAQAAVIAGFVDGGAGHEPVPAGASPVAAREAAAAAVDSGRKAVYVAVKVSAPAVAAHGDQAHVQEIETPYSFAFSVASSSPSGLHLAQLSARESICSDGGDAVRMSAEANGDPAATEAPQLLNQARYHSLQPTLTISTEEPPLQQRERVSDSTRHRRFDHLKTGLSARIERQLSTLRRMSIEEETAGDNENIEVPSADRYFSALEGPELSTLRATEVLTLPDDETWPFLLRFPVSAFGMCLGVSSQAMLWKSLNSEPFVASLGVGPAVNQALWWVSVALMCFVSVVYLLKAVFYLEAVRREFHNPTRVNFFFAPWVACLFLVKGLPRPVHTIPGNQIVWYVLMTPILLLDLKIYGQWMSGGERRLSKVANPTSHLAVVGNFVGALLGARVGLHEAPLFFFAVGLVHYVVLLVTLYQWLHTDAQLPRELHPVFFLFIAAPSVASMAWARLCGEFSFGAKIAYFVSVFFYMSMVARINFFRGVRFSLAWWAYTFPMTSVALATTMYASSMDNVLTRALAIGLAGIASVTVTGVLVATVYHALVRKDLFPNDVSIAITQRPTPHHAVPQLPV